MSKVSIVLSTYNGEKYLSQQLDSILNGDFADFQIEISDDCSSDGTVSLVRNYIEKYPDKISLHINEKNEGYAMNFLHAIQRSDSPYIMLCDQDDIWLPNKISLTLSRMIKEEEQGKKPILVFTDANLYDTKTEQITGLFQKNSHYNTEKVDISHILMENKCIGCTVMINDEVRNYLKVLPKEIRVHDWWLALICASFGKISYLDIPTLNYRQHDNNMIGGITFQSYILNRLSSIKKQREAVRLCCQQGQAFGELFQQKLTTNQQTIIRAFAKIPSTNWFNRRLLCIRYGFWKSGLTRNAGLLFIL